MHPIIPCVELMTISFAKSVSIVCRGRKIRSASRVPEVPGVRYATLVPFSVVRIILETSAGIVALIPSSTTMIFSAVSPVCEKASSAYCFTIRSPNFSGSVMVSRKTGFVRYFVTVISPSSSVW